MTELLRNAWQGWLRFTDGGKLAAIAMVALLFLWLSGRWKEQKALFSYTVVMAILCIMPVTAAGLMLYQTKYYDYEWVWSLVPITVVAAWGITEFLEESWKGFSLSQWKRGLSVTGLVLALLVLCSGLGQTGIDRKEERLQRQRAGEIIQRVMEQEGDICLWAPREILAYTRELTGAVRLIYGRNMWDESLNAYAYDTYPQEIQELYLWMENADPTGMALLEDSGQGELRILGESCMTAAAEAGVTCILLPGNLEPETVEELAGVWGGSMEQIGGYYLLTK